MSGIDNIMYSIHQGIMWAYYVLFPLECPHHECAYYAYKVTVHPADYNMKCIHMLDCCSDNYSQNYT